MQDCPTEIWTRIFAFACTDDGQTGRNLALVSRYVHDASQGVRFERVVLPSLEKMQAFAGMLEELPVERRRVRTLDIAVDMSVENGSDSHEYIGSLEGKAKSSWGDGATDIDEWMCECRQRGLAASEALEKILCMVGGHVEDLSIWFNASYDRTFVFLPPVMLPSLVRFTFRGERLPATRQTMCCPNLKEMTVVWDQFPVNVKQHVERMAPGVKDLRIVCRSERDLKVMMGYV